MQYARCLAASLDILYPGEIGKNLGDLAAGSDDLQLGQDEVRAEGKGREESGKAKVPDDHERGEFTFQVHAL